MTPLGFCSLNMRALSLFREIKTNVCLGWKRKEFNFLVLLKIRPSFYEYSPSLAIWLVTVGGTETPWWFQRAIISYTKILNLRSDISVPRSSCPIPLSSRTLDLRRASEGRTGIWTHDSQVTCREHLSIWTACFNRTATAAPLLNLILCSIFF